MSREIQALESRLAFLKAREAEDELAAAEEAKKPPPKRSEMSNRERLDYATAHGQEAYFGLPD